MKLGKIVSRIEIDPRKLTDYALNPDNPVGKDKAIVFERQLGYTRSNYEHLLTARRLAVLDAEAEPTTQDEHGQRYRVDLTIQGINEQTAV
ncbi:MAG: DUF6883 domain-containing protein, partial [Cyanobacteria bacterium J06626_23]